MIERVARGWRTYRPDQRWVMVLSGLAVLGLVAIRLSHGKSLPVLVVALSPVWLVLIPWQVWRRGESPR
jgi:hypothetical protein